VSFEDDLATLSLCVEKNGKQALYQQIAEQIRQMIYRNRLSPGERLPSSRKLANLLNVSRTSTLNAYDQLIAEGLLITRASSGIFVTQLGEISNSVNDPIQAPELQPEAPTPKRLDDQAQGGFDSGPDVAGFPSDDWLRSLSRVWRHPDPDLLRGQHPGGYWSLRQTVTQYVKALRGINCAPEQVIITAGSRDALALLTPLLLQHHAQVALENPCYPPLRQGLLSQGVKIVNCPVDKEGMLLPDMAVKLAWMTPARQYPLGVSQSTERRLEWLEYSRRQQCWLLEDDYDSEYHYRKLPSAPLFNLASRLPVAEQRVILVGSFSKVMFRNLRIGYMIVPPTLVAQVLAIQESLGNMASVPIQPALADFLGHRRFVNHLRRMRGLYRQRRDYLYQLVQQKLANYVRCELPDGGMHLLLHIRPEFKINDQWIEQQMKLQGLYVHALSKHYAQVRHDIQPSNNSGLLLGFSGVTEKQLGLGVEQLLQLLNIS